MKTDTRITLGIALVYVINSLSGIFSDTPTFLPMLFLNYFLIAALALIFTLLPPYKFSSIIFFIFSGLYLLMGLSGITSIKDSNYEIAILLGLLIINTATYIYQAVQGIQYHKIFALPFMLFMIINLSGMFLLPGIIALSFSAILGFVQVYILARPDLMQQVSVPVKRFFLLTTMFFLFEVMTYIFVRFAIGA